MLACTCGLRVSRSSISSTDAAHARIHQEKKLFKRPRNGQLDSGRLDRGKKARNPLAKVRANSACHRLLKGFEIGVG